MSVRHHGCVTVGITNLTVDKPWKKKQPSLLQNLQSCSYGMHEYSFFCVC